MKLYACQKCKTLIYFENNVCLTCGHSLGFDSRKLGMITLVPESNQSGFVDILDRNEYYKFCGNAIYGTCNWLIPQNEASTFCDACQLNRMIPTLSSQNMERWKRIEVAKHRLVYSLLRLGLSFLSNPQRYQNGLTFDFLADSSPVERVVTGHDNGVITLNIEEADEMERVKNKLDLGEKYRTLLGHFRHESGHYYWDVLIKNDFQKLERFREVFGDERTEYQEALQRYYSNNIMPQWLNDFISPYATAHPWEDWAETWSHYLHMMDALETAFYFGVGVRPEIPTGVKNLNMQINKDPYAIADFDEVFKNWLPLNFAVNSLNRSMGHPDFYPFVVSPTVVAKLKFIHELCREEDAN